MRFTHPTTLAAAALLSTATAHLNLQQAHQSYVQHCADITTSAASGAACCDQAHTTCVAASGGDDATCADLQAACQSLTGGGQVQRRQIDVDQAWDDYVEHCVKSVASAEDGAECCSQAYATCIEKSGGSVATCMPLQRTCRAGTGN